MNKSLFAICSWIGQMKILVISTLMSLTMVGGALAQATGSLTNADRKGIADSVVAADPQGNGALSRGFTEGSGGITPREAAGIDGPVYVVPAPVTRIAPPTKGSQE